MRRIEKAITPRSVSKDQPIPSMAEFLATYELEDLAEMMADEEWELRTLLNSYDKSTFEKDFESLKPAKRRRLQNSLNDAMEALQPPTTPSPEKPPAREKPAASPPRRYGRGPGSRGSGAGSSAGSSRRGRGRGAASSMCESSTAGGAPEDGEEEEEDDAMAADEEELMEGRRWWW